jgi:hypothetical protein
MLHKIKYRKIGSHIHCKMYTGYQPGNMGQNGELVFREEEFKQFRKSQYGIIWFEEESNDGLDSDVRGRQRITGEGFSEPEGD